jgi:hypothetical protein
VKKIAFQQVCQEHPPDIVITYLRHCEWSCQTVQFVDRQLLAGRVCVSLNRLKMGLFQASQRCLGREGSRPRMPMNNRGKFDTTKMVLSEPYLQMRELVNRQCQAISIHHIFIVYKRKIPDREDLTDVTELSSSMFGEYNIRQISNC